MNKTSILLLNTGTPTACTLPEVKRYLTEFLMDRRVLDLPFWLREIVVKWCIVPLRYKKSAKAYAKIWTPYGSPLMVHSRALAGSLQEELALPVEIGLSYSKPSIKEALRKLHGSHHIIVVPLFPQYASATSGSVLQEVMCTISKWEAIPKLSFLGPFFDNDLFIDAWVENARHIAFEEYDNVLFSFHGLPVRHVKRDTTYSYPMMCEQTAKAIAERLNISRYKICYQSRLGKDKWLEPYTQNVIKQERKLGAKKLLVFAPSFVADCLETSYEIGMEYREEFLTLGGEVLDLVPSLNTSPGWIKALTSMIKGSCELQPVSVENISRL